MAVITIEGIAPYDGDHEIDLTTFTLGELARIHDISKLRPAELNEALIYEDAKLTVALTVVGLERQGHRVRWLEPFWNAPNTAIAIDLTRGPGVPEPVPPTDSPLTNVSVSGESVRSDSSGKPGPPDGAQMSESDPSATGSPGSATSSASGPETSPA